MHLSNQPAPLAASLWHLRAEQCLSQLTALPLWSSTRCRNSENRDKKGGWAKEQWKLQKSIFSRTIHTSCSALTPEPQLRSMTPSASQGSQSFGRISLLCFISPFKRGRAGCPVCCPPAGAGQISWNREGKMLTREKRTEQGPGWLPAGFQRSPGNGPADYYAFICSLRCRRHGPQYAWANGSVCRLNHYSFSMVILCLSSHGKDPSLTSCQ